MELWPDWENLFIPLHSYSYIKTLLLFWTGILIFVSTLRETKITRENRKKLRVQFWTEGRKLLSVQVIASFEISEVQESGIPVSKFLVPVLGPVQAIADFHF